MASGNPKIERGSEHLLFKMKKIIIITSEFPPGPGGIGQHSCSLANALAIEQYDVCVLATTDYTTLEEVTHFDHKQRFSIIRYPRNGKIKTYFTRLKITRKTIQNFQPHAIILTGKFSLWQGLLIKKWFQSTPLLAVLHGSEVNQAHAFWRRVTHKAIANADILIPVSSFTRSLLPHSVVTSHPHIVVIPNGIDKEDSHISTASPLQLKGEPSLITVGHVSPRKGQHRVIKALPELIQKYPNIHYHMVGRPVTQEKLEALAQRLGVATYITFHGRVKEHKDLASYYKAANIFMLLSENQKDGDVEGFGIVALEANRFGLPVVGAKYCGVEEAVRHEHSGYLVDGDNTEEILAGVDFCMAHKEQIFNEAKTWAKQHLWSEIVKQYTNCIENLR
jgi:phosphatidylinositol alpha-1,6-mannosyltransferase